MPSPKVLLIEHESLFSRLCAQQLAALVPDAPTCCPAAELDAQELPAFSHVLLETGSSNLEDFPLQASFLKALQPKQRFLAIGPAANLLAHWAGAKQQALGEWQAGQQQDCIVGGASHPLLANFPRQFPAIFYHKWVIQELQHPDWLITGRDPNSAIVALRHKERPWEGVQFQPSSSGMPQRNLFWKTWLQTEGSL